MFLIAKRLISLRNHAGLTQREVANLIQISRTAYSNYENNNREPSLEMLYSIAKLYGVPMSYIIDEFSLFSEDNAKEYATLKPFLTNLSEDEIILLNKYKSLDEKSKQRVDELINSLNNNT